MQQASVHIFGSHMAFMHATQPQGPEEDIPDTIVDSSSPTYSPAQQTLTLTLTLNDIEQQYGERDAGMVAAVDGAGVGHHGGLRAEGLAGSGSRW
ncbi:MAG: hypothetical protein AB7V18_20490 [Pyrinomonadaceae bacterium]